MNKYEVILIIKKIGEKKRFHITLDNRRFYNGTLISFDSDETLDIQDDEIGYYPIPYSKIINVEPFKKKK